MAAMEAASEQSAKLPSGGSTPPVASEGDYRETVSRNLGWESYRAWHEEMVNIIQNENRHLAYRMYANWVHESKAGEVQDVFDRAAQELGHYSFSEWFGDDGG